MIQVSGLPVEAALGRLRQAGYEDIHLEIIQGRAECEQGVLRALRFQNGTLLAARFPAPCKGGEAE